MTNQEKFLTSYSDLIDLLYSFTGSLKDVKNTKDINEDDLNLLGELTTNIKRMGDTVIIEQSSEDIQPQKVNKKTKGGI